MRGVGLCALAMIVGAPATAQIVYSGPGSTRPSYDRVELQQIYFHRLQGLRSEALRRQAADGGSLTPESRAELQSKLNRINATRARDARRNDIMSVDAFGVERRSER
ncbi:hypothetical protein SPHI_01980 [Sphingomonas jeddahensis]|uniref:Uncharacterized protein n=1 Tax=Sphingomonas jeddahensis TaxID=1915074 RepID=A0A1V2EZ58_9SPHN|nr:hypothetical protein SPHI_01980 [Sphingomonas jeddahensis]